MAGTGAKGAPIELGVAILGGGMAGGLLARQLSRALPDLTIGLFERSEERPWKVGESTVELASNYFLRRLGLSSYLYEHQLPKNGLRFFFDRPQLDTPLEQMSEIGSESLPYHPSFQVDRSTLDADLRAMNAEAGVRVRTGVRVSKLRLGRGGEPHRFVASDGSDTVEYQARWLVDASGRARLVSKQQELGVRESALPNTAVWGRFDGVADLDDLGDRAFRERVRHTSRRLSTVHFVHPGYWIWFIPLRGGITSVGVVGDQAVCDPSLRTEEGFWAFLRRHRAASSLLDGAKMLDLGAYTHLAYRTRRFFSGDRIGCTGEAACFVDPFYSPGADFIALENDMICDLVARDHAGEGFDAVAERAALFDSFMDFRQEAAFDLYRGQYARLGSWDTCKLKWDFDVGSYYNLWVDSYMRDLHLDEGWLRSQVAQRPFVLRALAHFRDLYDKVAAELERRGETYRNNRGRYSDGRDLLWFQTEVGRPRDDARVVEVTEEIFNRVLHAALDVIEGGPAAKPRERRPLPAFMGRRPLV